MKDEQAAFDAIIIGAGFAGVYMLYRLRDMGYNVRVYEAADGVGGTWYWNRYPGARCDAESLAYSFSFDEELVQEWEWTERYATQPEILDYAEHVADRYDLRPHMLFERRVMAAHYDETANLWRIQTDEGDTAHAPILISAIGCLSVPALPHIPGLDDFQGERYQASQWPHHRVLYEDKHVGVIGTGSSAIQSIPVIAETAQQLTVFQRTPNFSVPAANGPLDADWVRAYKKNYRAHRENYKWGLTNSFGDLTIDVRHSEPVAEFGRDINDEDLEVALEESWKKGGASFMSTVMDSMANQETNDRFAAFIHCKIHEAVDDPVTAAALCPTSHPVGSRRICVDIDYYKTYNRDNVSLVNLLETPIERITETGIQLSDRHVELDMLVLATGFDAMTGAFNKIDIRGRGNKALKDKWADGPKTYLGLMMVDFPNLFTITGPGSPSVLSNMLISIEQHVDMIADCLTHAKEQGAQVIEPTQLSEDYWMQHAQQMASETLFPKGSSWYLGANIKGKPQVFMPYTGGVGGYREICDKIIAQDWRGFSFTAHA